MILGRSVKERIDKGWNEELNGTKGKIMEREKEEGRGEEKMR